MNEVITPSSIKVSFFLHGKAFVLFGAFDYLDGFVDNAVLKLVCPTTGWVIDKLSSAQIMYSNETDPSSMQHNLTEKYTGAITRDTHTLVPANHTFSGLRYIGVFFEGGSNVNVLEFTVEMRMWITGRSAP